MPAREIIFESLRVLAWMSLPVIVGYAIWARGLSGANDGERLARAIARVLGLTAVLGAASPLMLLVVWIAPMPAGKALALPLVGLIVHVVGSMAGLASAWLSGEPRERRGAYLLGGGCSNVLTFGGITVVLLLGTASDPGAEHALGEMAIYRLAEAPYYFLVAWPLAAVVSGPAGEPAQWGVHFRRALRGPTMAPIVGILIGAALNIWGVERPDSFAGVAQVLVRINVVLLGITVGLGLRQLSPRRHLRPSLEISAIKFVLMPTVGIGLAWLCGLRGSTLQVIAICASMPVAFMAVVGAVLYRLDDELVASFWLVTTLAMLVVVPALAVIVRWIGA